MYGIVVVHKIDFHVPYSTSLKIPYAAINYKIFEKLVSIGGCWSYSFKLPSILSLYLFIN